jgi:dihydrolipoamide dehydrogenase
MTGPDVYDVIVVGAGSTGENVADRVVQGGLTAVMVEAELVGGDCSYWACMPSKALLRGPEAVTAARAVAGARESVTGRADEAATLHRRDGFTSHWSDEAQVSWATSRHIDLVRGHGRITAPRQVTVATSDGTERLLSARHAVAVCTGSRAAVPPVDGLNDVDHWTPRDATRADHIPDSMIVLGGGAVGCEVATAYAALGCTVTVLEAAPHVLSNVEAFAADAVAASLRGRGVSVLTDTKALSAGRGPGGGVTVTTGQGEITADVLLVATGREPRTDDLGLDAVGLKAGQYLPIDDSCRVTAADGDWLYAAGDVTGRRLFTHQGKYEARICGDVIVARANGEPVDTAAWSPHQATADHLAAPAVIFTDPQVALVGRTEQQARDAGLTVSTVDYDIGSVAGASLFADDYAGHARIVVDEDRHVLVGATLVGANVSEMIHAATVAIVGEVPLHRLWHAVPAYPTISELWLRLLENYGPIPSS